MRILYLFLMAFLFAFPSLGVTVQDIRFSASSPQKVRLVADLSEKTEAKVFRLQNPPRLVVDFEKTTFSSVVKNNTFKPVAFIEGIRLGVPQPNIGRLVLDIPTKDLTENHFFLPPGAGKTWRFVIDLTLVESADSGTTAYHKGLTPFPAKTPRQKIVMLDPGHGGQDPGAISSTGKYEKHLTLLFANEAKKVLEKKGYTVYMTRTNDTAVSLRSRIEKAHKHNADIFISIHADSAKNKSAKGLSIYTISEKASDAEAAALAERENKADIILGINLEEYQESIGNILIDLAKRDTMDKSAQYAELFVKEVRHTAQLKSTPHRTAGFVVLKSPNIPSVLIELGYLSNKQEEKMLQKKSYRAEIITSLAKGLDQYFKELGD